jgi:hypothetical protein
MPAKKNYQIFPADFPSIPGESQRPAADWGIDDGRLAGRDIHPM